MQQTKKQLYSLVKDLLSEDEFNQQITELSKEFDTLLDEYTLALFLVDKLGRNTQAKTNIIDIKNQDSVTIIGTISNITEPRTFKRNNGSSGKVVNLILQDETGSCRVVLWNDDVDLVKNKKIKNGTTVKIINGYVKQGYNGTEVNLGRWGILDVNPKEQVNLGQTQQKQTSVKNQIIGKIIHVEPTRAFFKDNGEFGFVANIKIQDNNKEYSLVVWDEKVKEIQQFKIGETLKINNINQREKNGVEELHINGTSHIEKG